MKYFTVDILTPSKIIAKGIPSESLLIPTTRGQINILENHTHVITKIVPGILSVFGGPDYGDRNFVISTGVCKVLEDRVVILSNTAEESMDVDVERAKLALKNAEDHLRNTDGLTVEDIDRYQQKLERAKIRIQIGEFIRPR
jgi:F-type H+-transporting ATPase subunit epsilon